MEYKTFPTSNVTVSKLCLGTMMFGKQTSEEESLKIMDYAFDNGINFFDTADLYNVGESERIVGKWLKGKRDKIILTTKVRGPMGDDPNDQGLSRRHILSAVEASLERLGTDYIDFYYMHAPDYQTSLEESLDTMSTLVRSGKVRYIGISNYPAWRIADILAICDKRGYVPPVVTQNVYNMITRGIETELIPCVNEHNMGMVIYNPIAGGLLTGKHKPGKPAENTRFANAKAYYDRYWSDENFVAVEKLGKIAASHGMSLLELAMKWCDAQKSVVSILTGVSRLEQLEQNIASVEGAPLDAEILAECDEVWSTLAGNRYSYFR
jgi:aryl-alcohol dehydrogenase-like predicted oxidoreductase